MEVRIATGLENARKSRLQFYAHGCSVLPPSSEGTALHTGDRSQQRSHRQHQLAAERRVVRCRPSRLDSIAATYSEDFLCVQVADEGGFTRLTREQRLSFLKLSTSGAAGGHSVPSKDSQVHHAEIFGDTALVLVTASKIWRRAGNPCSIPCFRRSAVTRGLFAANSNVYPILRFTRETRRCLKIYFVSLKQIEENLPLVRQTDRR